MAIQTKLKNRLWLFNANCMHFEVMFFNLFYPPLSHLQGKQALYFHSFSFPQFSCHFGQQQQQFGIDHLLSL